MQQKRYCEICGKEYYSNSRKYLHCCSNKCLAIKKDRYNTPGIAICKNCGKEYYRSKPGWGWSKANELAEFTTPDRNSSLCSIDNFCSYTCGKEYISKKAKNTNILRHGGVGFASKKLREKGLCTTEKRYGDKYFINSSKAKQTCLERYGVDNAAKSQEIREKLSKSIQKAHLERHSEIIAKTHKTKLERYGNENYVNTEKIKKTNLKKYGVENYFESEQFKNKNIQINLTKYGVPYACMTKQCREADPHAISKINKKLANALNGRGIPTEFEYYIKKYSYDIKLKNDNILIEINPTITHSSSNQEHLPLNRFKPKDPYYHYNKTKQATEAGYRCIHIWDWDSEDKVIASLNKKQTVYARKLNIREVSEENCHTFLNTFHFQSTCNGQIVRLGLYMGDELIELMTFGKPRYNKNYEWELLRLCTKAEYKVVGGAEKLFSEFVSKYKPKSITSYCDNSKFTGEVYKRLGMNLLDYGKPTKHWYNIQTKRHITDNLLRQRGYSQLHNDKVHKKGESNTQLMLEAGYLEVYDCGQSVYSKKF